MHVNHCKESIILFVKDVNKTFLPSLHIGGLSFVNERRRFLHSAQIDAGQCIDKELQYTEIKPKYFIFPLAPCP